MQRSPASFVALPFPGAVQEPCKPPPAALRQSREATHFGVAHDEGTEQQARQQDSHGGEAGALASGPTKEGEVRGRSGGARRRAAWVTAVHRAEARSRLSSLGAPARRRMGTRSGDSALSLCTAGAAGGGGRRVCKSRSCRASARRSQGGLHSPAAAAGGARGGGARDRLTRRLSAGLRAVQLAPRRGLYIKGRPSPGPAPPRPGIAASTPFPSPSLEPAAARTLGASSATTGIGEQRGPLRRGRTRFKWRDRRDI